MTLQQVQALTPSFNWSVYLKAMRVPATEKYLVTSPDFFKGMEKLKDWWTSTDASAYEKRGQCMADEYTQDVPEAARTAVPAQGHSLNRYRVNNVVSNMSEFAHAFGCKVGQPMVHANACRVW